MLEHWQIWRLVRDSVVSGWGKGRTQWWASVAAVLRLVYHSQCWISEFQNWTVYVSPSCFPSVSRPDLKLLLLLLPFYISRICVDCFHLAVFIWVILRSHCHLLCWFTHFIQLFLDKVPCIELCWFASCGVVLEGAVSSAWTPRQSKSSNFSVSPMIPYLTAWDRGYGIFHCSCCHVGTLWAHKNNKKVPPRLM